MNRRTPRASIASQLAQVEAAIARSQPIWRGIYRIFRQVLRSKRSRAAMAKRLRATVGRRTRNEPACLESFRITARRIERAEPLSLL